MRHDVVIVGMETLLVLPLLLLGGISPVMAVLAHAIVGVSSTAILP